MKVAGFLVVFAWTSVILCQEKTHIEDIKTNMRELVLLNQDTLLASLGTIVLMHPERNSEQIISLAKELYGERCPDDARLQTVMATLQLNKVFGLLSREQYDENLVYADGSIPDRSMRYNSAQQFLHLMNSIGTANLFRRLIAIDQKRLLNHRP